MDGTAKTGWMGMDMDTEGENREGETGRRDREGREGQRWE